MKSEKLFAVVFVFTLMVTGQAVGACSNATLQGNYGFTIGGANSSNQPAATVGQITADGKGGLAGFETISDDGVITENVSTTGNYSIISNCTGTASITPSGGSTSNYGLVLDSAGKQIELVETDKGFTEAGYGLAQVSANCSVAGLKGTYGSHGAGFNASLTPYSVVSQVTLDGAGNFAGTQTGSVGGTIFSDKIAGTYSVNANCIGTSTGTGKHPSHSYFVVVNGGRSALQISADSDLILTFSVEKR